MASSIKKKVGLQNRCTIKRIRIENKMKDRINILFFTEVFFFEGLDLLSIM